MPASKARIKANDKYNQKAYEQIKIYARKELRLNELIKIVAQRRNISRQAYIVMAIEQQLSYDNITIESLNDLPGTNENISEDKESE